MTSNYRENHLDSRHELDFRIPFTYTFLTYLERQNHDELVVNDLGNQSDQVKLNPMSLENFSHA